MRDEILTIAIKSGSVVVEEMPRGYEHVAGLRLQPLCRLLGIQYADAVVGWKQWGASSYPEFNGVVVTRGAAKELKGVLAEREERSSKRARLLIRSVEDLAVEVPVLDRVRLLDCVFGRGVRRGNLGDVVSHVRHHLTSYDEELRWLKGQPGAEEASWHLKRRYLHAIAAAYPWLAETCECLVRNLKLKRCEQEHLAQLLETARYPGALAGRLEGPGLAVQVAQCGDGPVLVRLTGLCGAAYASVGDPDFITLTKQCCESRDVDPLLHWLSTNQVGASPFQAVVRRYASGEAIHLLPVQEEKRRQKEAKSGRLGRRLRRVFKDVVPDFKLSVCYGRFGPIQATIATRGPGGSATAAICDAEFLELARFATDGRPLLNWLAERDVGKERFRVALECCMRGDVQAWQQYNGAGVEGDTEPRTDGRRTAS